MTRTNAVALVLAAAALAAAATALSATAQDAQPQQPAAGKIKEVGDNGKPKPPAGKPGIHLTVYNENFALVKDRRELPDVFKKGVNVILFRDVAATIDPTSVHFRSLTDPKAQVLEQNYEFDLVSAEKLLQKYVDQKIAVQLRDGKSYEGTLLSYDNQRLVLAGDGAKGPISLVERGDNVKRIQFSKLPEGLLTRPTLVWEVEARKPGKHAVEVSYIARQVRWRADYNLVLNKDDKTADISGWVTVENNSGIAYANAAVKLMASGGRPLPDPSQGGVGPEAYKLLRTVPPTDQAGADPSEALGDYRVYRLPEATTIANNQIKQVELIKASAVPVKRTYLYDGSRATWRRGYYYDEESFGVDENKKVHVLLELDNRKAANLGIALPAGKVRAYKQDASSLEFIGEDMLPPTARDEKVVLYVGDAFDIVGERKQEEYRRIDRRHVQESFKITLRNHKKEAVQVQVVERMYRAAEWNIVNTSHPNERLDARTLVFRVDVPPDGEATVTYKVDYRW